MVDNIFYLIFIINMVMRMVNLRIIKIKMMEALNNIMN